MKPMKLTEEGCTGIYMRFLTQNLRNSVVANEERPDQRELRSLVGPGLMEKSMMSTHSLAGNSGISNN